MADLSPARINSLEFVTKPTRRPRDGRAEPRGLAPPSAAVPVPLLLGLGQVPKRRALVPNHTVRGRAANLPAVRLVAADNGCPFAQCPAWLAPTRDIDRLHSTSVPSSHRLNALRTLTHARSHDQPEDGKTKAQSFSPLRPALHTSAQLSQAGGRESPFRHQLGLVTWQ